MDIINTMLFGLTGLIIGFFIPVLSKKMILIKGKKKDITLKNNIMDSILFQIIVILCNGALWTFAAFHLKPSVSLLCSILFTLAIMFSIIDIRIHIIPNELVLITAAAGIILQLLSFGFKSFFLSFACMLIMMILFLLLGMVLGLDKFGAGDVKLAGAMGLVLGYPFIITAVLCMSVALIVYCIIGIWIKKLTLVSMIPMAPFMMLGMVISLGSLVTQQSFYI